MQRSEIFCLSLLGSLDKTWPSFSPPPITSLSIVSLQLHRSVFNIKVQPRAAEKSVIVSLRSRPACLLTPLQIHFSPIIRSHTDEKLGDCSFLDTCRNPKVCKYIHYELSDTTLIPNSNLVALATRFPDLVRNGHSL